MFSQEQLDNFQVGDEISTREGMLKLAVIDDVGPFDCVQCAYCFIKDQGHRRPTSLFFGDDMFGSY